MTKDEIITEMYTDPIYNEILFKFSGKKYYEDLRQEIYLILLDKDEDLIVKAYEDKKLKYYFIRIILNQAKSSTSPFYKKFKDKMVNTMDNEEEFEYKVNEQIDEPTIQFDIIKYCNKHKLLNWYQNEILTMYYKLDSNPIDDEKITMRKIEESYGISHNSIYWTLNKIKRKIREHIKNNKIND